MKIFSYIPLFAVLLVLYIIIMMFNPSYFGTGAKGLFEVTLISGASWQPTIGDIFVLLGVVILYVEIFKATRTSASSIIEHGISMLVFLIYFIMFIAVEAAGTSTFLILTMMSLLDVVAGFTVSISAARRDFGT